MSSFAAKQVHISVQRIENDWNQIYNLSFTLAELQEMTVESLLVFMVGRPNVGAHDIRFIDNSSRILYVRNIRGFREAIIQLATSTKVN